MKKSTEFLTLDINNPSSTATTFGEYFKNMYNSDDKLQPYKLSTENLNDEHLNFPFTFDEIEKQIRHLKLNEGFRNR